MKISTLLLTTLAAAVLTSCEKSSVKPATDEATQQPGGVIRPNGDGPQDPYDCPACGMG